MSQIHIQRSKALLKEFPEIRKLVGPNRITALFVLGVAGLQLWIATQVAHLALGWLVLAAYIVGAMLSHANYVLVHECAHNLLFTRARWNYIFGIICDTINIIPTSVTFRAYHLKHHMRMGEYEYDADLPSHYESKLVGNSTIKKTLWMFFFAVAQSLRPLRLRDIKPSTPWLIASFAVCIAVDSALYYYSGGSALLYLGLSSFFGLGLHPLGARWIQEHFTKDGLQETFSYYGPANVIAFNVGFHNEHHDFPMIAWTRLPKVYQLGKKQYDGIKSYQSWSGLLLNFLTDPAYSTDSRIVRNRDEKNLHELALNS